MAQVIGFLKYEDFVRELEELQLATNDPVVRVQDYSKYKVVRECLRREDFTIEATTVNGDDVLVCRFQMGAVLDRLEEEEAVRRRGDVQLAKAALIEDLETRGYTVRAGLVAAARESETSAAPRGLWRWEREGDKDRLVIEGQGIGADG